MLKTRSVCATTWIYRGTDYTKLTSLLNSKTHTFFSAINTTEIYSHTGSISQVVSSGRMVPINLLRPFVAKIPGYVILFGGKIFETGQPNPSVLLFNLMTFSWSILDAQIQTSAQLIIQYISLDIFKAPRKF